MGIAVAGVQFAKWEGTPTTTGVHSLMPLPVFEYAQLLVQPGARPYVTPTTA